ncbi:uncharacterized protein LOC131596794 [Vicia villosa]|uniref:uncharacterized protein LOC131596794 n=1 Tax=Vicia villosa TaxID=3911 RepID=UPI00273C488D|nr:uncharacterized protein LOC131596794 [Vicia villosa]
MKWNKEIFGLLDLEVNSTINTLNNLDSMVAAVEGRVNADIAAARIVASESLWDAVINRESILKQKSRCNWKLEGDTDTKYFCNVMKARILRNSIVGLSTPRGSVIEVEEVKAEILNHFANRFVEIEVVRSVLDGVEFNCLSSEDLSHLEAPFLFEEVKEIVWLGDCEKSPGLDGFPLGFLKKCWNFVSHDVMKFVQNLHAKRKLPKAIPISFLALIPKNDSPQKVEDYRLICLIGCLYRLLSKLLDGRLKKVIGKLVSLNQFAFIEGRQMINDVLVLNEVADFAKINRRNKWCLWMEALVFSSMISMLVNGSSTAKFVASRGLRQGDPMSQFLFLLVAEDLAGLMQNAAEYGGFWGFHFNEHIHFELLQFADNANVLCDGSMDNLWCIKAVLRGFELVSGLCININKSKIYDINIGTDFLAAAANFLPCEIGSMPFVFLGLPVGANHRRKTTWKPIFTKLSRKLAAWQGKHLSLGEPRVVWEEIIKIQRTILWERRMTKEECVRFVGIRYGDGLTYIHDEIPENKVKKYSLWWRYVRVVYKLDTLWFLNSISCKLGAGDKFSFWNHHWVGNFTLKSLFPNLFSNSVIKHFLVAESGQLENGVWEWEFGVMENTDNSLELLSLCNVLADVDLNHNSSDEVLWGSDNEDFLVKSAYQRLYLAAKGDVLLDAINFQVIHNIWKAKVPRKIKIFGWRYILNSLPMREELWQRGVIIDMVHISCVDGGSRVAFSGGNNVRARRFGVVVLDRICDCLESCVRLPFVVFFWLLITWSIWRARNDLVFSNKVWDVRGLVMGIKFMGCDWYSIIVNRGIEIDGDVWFTNPLNLVGI